MTVVASLARVLTLRAAIVAGAAGLGAFLLVQEAPAGVDRDDILNAVVGWTFVGSGVLAWHRRPANRIGPLLTIAGLVWLVGRTLQQFDSAITFTGGIIVGVLWPALVSWILLAFPEGRLATRFDRTVLTLIAVGAGPAEIAWLLFWEPAGGPGNALLISPNEVIADAIDTIQRFVIVVGLLVLAGLLTRRWYRAGVALRRSLMPVLAGAVALLFGAVLTILDKFDVPTDAFNALVLLLFAGIPIMVVVALVQARLARAGVAELVVELRDNPSPHHLREMLARALGDPSLTLAYWLTRTKEYVDTQGQHVDATNTAPGRAATRIDGSWDRVALLIHDDAILAEPELLSAVATTAAIALENGQLHAELTARLADLQASRTRVIEAGQVERKQLARNLHDGAQQRLVALSLQLSLLQRRLADDSRATNGIAQAKEEIAATLADLREVARGLHPSSLTLQGLPNAVRSMARRMPIPVSVDLTLPGQLREPIDLAIYYLVSESLANIGKHAQASSARIRIHNTSAWVDVEVRDDGVGGADTIAGSGLQGLADRVESLGGQFTVTSAPGQGTCITARLPCTASD
jgi:signal transduction histidine kinase